jgi:hypothetical protein
MVPLLLMLACHREEPTIQLTNAAGELQDAHCTRLLVSGDLEIHLAGGDPTCLRATRVSRAQNEQAKVVWGSVPCLQAAGEAEWLEAIEPAMPTEPFACTW